MKLAILVPALAAVFAQCSLAAELQTKFDIRNPSAFEEAVDTDAQLRELAADLKFTEGPQWFQQDGGYLIFSDIPANQINRWSEKEGLKTFRAPSNNTNGNTKDNADRLLSAEHSGRRVAITGKDGTVKTLVDSFEGKKLNSPNDVIVKSDGTIWFTDPDYGLKNKPGSKEKEGKEQPGNYVYRFDPQTKAIAAVLKDFDKPNGLCFSPDEKKLYVADSGQPKHIRVFDVNKDGTVSHGKVFCKIDKGGPDGIRCDKAGRIWSSAGDGVHIFNPDGQLIGKILTPQAPANLCFGGKDSNTLFITARASVYSIKVKARGQH